MTHSRAVMMVAAGLFVSASSGRFARAQDGEPDLTLHGGVPPDRGGGPTVAAPAAVVAARPEGATAAEVPWGFYRDRQGRMMQVSFDFGRRLWLGVGYAPHRTSSGDTEISPAAFDFGVSYDRLSEDGRTRERFTVLDGQVRLHSFGLDIVGFRYDLSHHYETPLLRITTFVKEPERHDLFLNVGFYTEALHFEVAPRGIEGEESLTLASAQATLDLWQSQDLRSYVRLRVGPGVEARLGPWGDEARFVGLFPQATLEGNLIIGRRAMQRLNFRLRGDLLRSATWHARELPGDWVASGEAAYEAILLAINDQPVSFRVAGSAFLRDDSREVVAGLPAARVLGWTGTAGIRMAFFSPPVPPFLRK